MNWHVYVWLFLLVVFLVVEASTVTMVSLWFAAGSLGALLMNLLGASWGVQVAAFALVSAILLSALRPMARKHFTPRLSKTNVDSVIGSQGLVTQTIDNLTATGQVKLGAMEWTARSTSGDIIEVGTRIRVDRIEGVKVFVSPVEVEAAV